MFSGDGGEGAKLFARFHPRFQGSGALDERGGVAGVELAIEADAEHAFALPPDDRRTSERSAVERHRRPDWQDKRTVQLRSARREVHNLHLMPISAELEEGGQGHWHARIDAAFRVGVLLGGWS